ncbi:MAG: ferric reductase-like transmembrane domain-containing protein, partial [Bacteroidota bacterium]
MSNTYRPVLWNRQKKIYDRIILGLVLLYILVFAGLQMFFFPNISIETLIIRATGSLAFLMLHIVLCIGPLSRLNPLFLPLLYNRRHLGVILFLIALIHGIFNLIQFHALGNVNPLLSLFTSNTHYDSFANFPFQTLGFFALLILFVMAATSHDFWLKNLSPKVWKSLHMMVYFAYALLLLHVFLGIAQLETAPLRIGLLALGLFTVSGLHLSAAILEKRKSQNPAPPNNDGFVPVC